MEASSKRKKPRKPRAPHSRFRGEAHSHAEAGEGEHRGRDAADLVPDHEAVGKRQIGGIEGVGVGGGFLIVPVLVLLLGIPMKEAVGTALLVISLKSATGFLGYLGHVDVYWGFIAAFTAIAVAGILIGAQLVRHIAPRVLKRFFAVFLVVIGIWILYQNRSVF